jgi:hypothetical protein
MIDFYTILSSIVCCYYIAAGLLGASFAGWALALVWSLGRPQRTLHEQIVAARCDDNAASLRDQRRFFGNRTRK